MVIFVGTTPDAYGSGGPCPGGTPLSVQVARVLAMVSVFGTAIALGVNLTSRQLSRIRAGWGSFDDVVVGLTDDAMAVVGELVHWAAEPDLGGPQRGRILALYTEEQSANGNQARALGVLATPYDRERVGADGSKGPLSDYLAKGNCWLHLPRRKGSRRVQLAGASRVWVFDGDPFTAVETADFAYRTLTAEITRRAKSQGRGGAWEVPQIRAVVPDRLLADSVRVRWLAQDAGGGGSAPIRTVVCPAETTAMELIGRVAAHYRGDQQGYQLVICGDSSLAESTLVELATRSWEEQDLQSAWEQHLDHCRKAQKCVDHQRNPQVHVGELPNDPADLLVGGPMPARTLVIGPFASALLAQVRRSLPKALERLLEAAEAVDQDWRGLVEWPAADLPTAVVVTEDLHQEAAYLGQRLQSLAPQRSVVWMPTGTPRRIFPQKAREQVLSDHPVQEYACNLFLADHAPEDAWNRIARHQHERYRRVNYDLQNKPKATRRPWWTPAGEHLPDEVRRSNLAAVRNTLAWFANNDYEWKRVKGEELPPDASWDSPPFGLSEDEFTLLLKSELARYSGTDAGLTAQDVKLTSQDREYTTVTIMAILRTLQANGYEPVRVAAPPQTQPPQTQPGTPKAQPAPA